MNILMGLVIAMFIITAVYVGYHAMQQPVEKAEGHKIGLDIVNFNSEIQKFQNSVTINVIT